MSRKPKHDGPATPRLTKRQRSTLDTLRVYGDWARPMDIGASDASHHTTTLRSLIRLGLVERKRRDGSSLKSRNEYGKQPYLYRAIRIGVR